MINPDAIVAEYGADSLRLYEMFMGPLEAVKPWSMKGVEGVYRFLARAWRMIVDAEADVVRLDAAVSAAELTLEQAKVVARTVAAVTDDFEALRFNTAISRLMEFVNFFTSQEVRPKTAMETFTLLLAPMAPHIAEELWQSWATSRRWPTSPGRVRPGALEGRAGRDPGAGQRQAARPGRRSGRCRRGRDRAGRPRGPRIAVLLEGKTVRKVVVVPGKLVNFVVG